MQADLMVIAPAPTPEDDLKGKPLMGATGQLFAKMVSAIGLTSSQIYMTPVVKCRPNQKDEVTTDQWKQCRRYWLSQVQHVQPAMILALGEVAGRSVADQENASLDSLRSNTYSVEGIPALVTHAPDFLLAHPAAKKEAWEDMKNLHAMICKRTGKKLSRKG
jgi:DNA polymerase